MNLSDQTVKHLKKSLNRDDIAPSMAKAINEKIKAVEGNKIIQK